MRRLQLAASLCLGLAPAAVATGGEVSVERGLQVSITGGCHDCHTEGYREALGKIDPTKAMMGSSIGWRGPWGTHYAVNLRTIVWQYNEDGWVAYLKNLQTLPPMPWYNVRAMDESDMRSLYLYLKSLSPIFDAPPGDVVAGEEPTTPFVTLVPPQMPQ